MPVSHTSASPATDLITDTSDPRLHAILLGGVLVLATLIPLYFSPLFPDYNLPKRTLTEVLVILLLVLWISGMAIKGRITFLKSSFYLPALAFLGINLISLFQATNVAQGLDMIFQQTCLFLVPVLVFHIVQTPRHIVALAAALAFTGGLIGLIGLLQYNGIASFYTRGTYPISTIGNVTFVAEYDNVVFPIALSLIFCFQNAYLRTAAVLSCLLMAGHLLVLGSRGGWLGVLVGLTVFALVYIAKYPQFRQNLRRAVVALIFLLAIWSVLEDLFNADQFAATYWNRVLSRVEEAITIKDDATRQRVHLWQDTLHMAADHPLAGVGVGNFEYALPRYTSQESYAIKARLEREHATYWGQMLGRVEKQDLMAFRAHNDYLEICAETGLPGLILFLFLLYTIAHTAYKQIQRHIEGRETLLIVGLSSGLVATAVHALFSMNFQNPVSALTFYLTVGLIFSHHFKNAPSSLKEETDGQKPPLPFPVSHFPCETERNDPSPDPSSVVHRPSSLISFPIARSYRVIAAGALILIATLSFEVQTLIGAYHYQLGTLWLKQQRFADAQNAFTRALQYRLPHPFMAYQALSLTYSNQKHWPEAIRTLQQSLEAYPDNIAALIYLSNAHEQSGRPKEALSALQHAETLNPYAVDLRLKIVRILFKLNEFKASHTELQQAQTLSAQDPDARYQVALTYLSCESPEPARAILQDLIAQHPKNADFHTSLALALFRLGNLKAAQAECQKAIQLDPKSPRPYLLLGTLYEADNAPELAQETYIQALKALPNDPNIQKRVEKSALTR